jgi:hypothetical protein
MASLCCVIEYKFIFLSAQFIKDGFTAELKKFRLLGPRLRRPLPKHWESQDFITVEDGTDRVSRNDGKELPPYAA